MSTAITSKTLKNLECFTNLRKKKNRRADENKIKGKEIRKNLQAHHK